MAIQRSHEIQISVKTAKVKGVKVTKELLQQAIRRLMNDGVPTPGIAITAIDWRVNGKLHRYTKPEDINDILAKLKYIPEIRPSIFRKVR